MIFLNNSLSSLGRINQALHKFQNWITYRHIRNLSFGKVSLLTITKSIILLFSDSSYYQLWFTRSYTMFQDSLSLWCRRTIVLPLQRIGLCLTKQGEFEFEILAGNRFFSISFFFKSFEYEIWNGTGPGFNNNSSTIGTTPCLPYILMLTEMRKNAAYISVSLYLALKHNHFRLGKKFEFDF